MMFILADCTFGEGWAAWGRCVPSNGTCGNGIRLRFKEELLGSRNGGDCENDPESEDCIKDCQPLNLTGINRSFDFS